MPWAPRKLSDAGIYHVGSRGAGLQIIFEDDCDRRRFVELIARYLGVFSEPCVESEQALEVLAWCLMSNHFHLVIKAAPSVLSQFMMRLLRAYSYYFNERHGRVGQLYQGHFWSEPILDEGQLLTVVRYVHQNPWKAGFADSCEWPWSSYSEYLGTPALTSTGLVLGILGGEEPEEEFARFCSQADFEADVRDGNERQAPLSDGDALDIARGILGEVVFREIASLPKSERDVALAQLKEAGLSIRQIGRLTGIGRGIISRA